MRDKPIVEALEKFVRQDPYSMHVPGHKNGMLSNLSKSLKEALVYDLTELEGLDDFHHPEEVIARAEALLAEVYGAEKSFFLVNGSTVGNLAMIYATAAAGDIVLVQRNAHKSVFHGLQLVGVKPVYLTPEWDEVTQTASSISLKTLKEALEKYPNAKALILTYPTYYGTATSELKEQIELCHAANIPVLVDEAHGAHFIGSKHFPKCAIALGADVVVQSAHKTLPAMTMASYMHVNSNLVAVEKINEYLRMLQSSSPSYLLLASLDDARHFIVHYSEIDYVSFQDKRQQFIAGINNLGVLQVIESDDPLKLLIRAKGYTGFQLKEVLDKQGVYVELADLYQVLLVLPLLKQGQIYPYAEIRLRIKEAIQTLKQYEKNNDVSNTFLLNEQKINIPLFSFEQMKQTEGEWVPYTRALGRIAASMLIPYPPGIPLLLPGEKITVAKLSELEELLAAGASFQGKHQLEQKLIFVIK